MADFPDRPLRRRTPRLLPSRLLYRPSPSLTFGDAVEVWKRHFLGEAQHHIAQAFGVNQGRVNEVLKERRHKGSRLVALGKNPLHANGR